MTIADKNRAGLMGPEQVKKLDKAITTDTGQVLTSPTINGGTLSGTFSGSHTYSGTVQISSGNATTAANFLTILPTNHGVGNYGLIVQKSTTANLWNILANDTVDNNGNVNWVVGSLQVNSSPVMTRGAAETITGAKTFTALTTTFAAAGNTTFEIGRTDGVAAFSGLDFHTGATATDFDSRILASGGTGSVGGGTLEIIAATLTVTAGAVFSLPPRLPSYTVATLPSAATYVRGLIYVSDGTSNKRQAVSDGTNWRWPDGAIVS